MESYASEDLDGQYIILGVCNIAAGPFMDLSSRRFREKYDAGGLCFAEHRRYRSSVDCDRAVCADASWDGASCAGHDAGHQRPVSGG